MRSPAWTLIQRRSGSPRLPCSGGLAVVEPDEQPAQASGVGSAEAIDGDALLEIVEPYYIALLEEFHEKTHFGHRAAVRDDMRRTLM
jgi:hypothetical protein